MAPSNQQSLRIWLLVIVAALMFLVLLQRLPSRQVDSQKGEAPIILAIGAQDLELHILPIGAVVQRLIVRDKLGAKRDVALGFDLDDLAPYQNGTSPYFGAVVGRVANRVKNAAFQLDGKTYHLTANDGNNSLHGGKKGWSMHTWSAKQLSKTSAKLTLVSPDGDEGYPGQVTASVTYTLVQGRDSTDVRMLFEAATTAPTPINMAQHCYFNLGGVHEPSDVLDHRIQINSSYYTPVDSETIPTGEVEPVKGTPFDFREEHAIGERIAQITRPGPGGYDTNMVLWGFDGPDAALHTHNCVSAIEVQQAASVHDPESGIQLDILTNSPGLQFYSGNFLDGSIAGKGGVRYPQHGAFALETQVFPNSINTPSFPQCVLRPGGKYEHKAIWRFRKKID
ncbi:hypothetical protein WJX73_002308 [Symbiochloris irregularis]|uniref:Aldose 1-epimerase n=1 Tax=Symbiochloris irregularis TaxID=706552 RepID=A0AAW1PCJ5_9CHLO